MYIKSRLGIVAAKLIASTFEYVRSSSVSVWQEIIGLEYLQVDTPACHRLVKVVEVPGKIFPCGAVCCGQELMDVEEERELVGPRAWRLLV